MQRVVKSNGIEVRVDSDGDICIYAPPQYRDCGGQNAVFTIAEILHVVEVATEIKRMGSNTITTDGANDEI